MGLRSIFNNIKNRGLKDVTNPKKIANYFDGIDITNNGLTIPQAEIMSYAEQLVYRSLKCPQCFKEGACVDCKCPQPLSAQVFNHECTLGNYESMKSPEAWEVFKKSIGLKFKIAYD